MTSRPGGIRVEVSDLGPGIDADVAEVSTGWGLRLVELLSDRWGIEDAAGGKVWFEVDTQSSPRSVMWTRQSSLKPPQMGGGARPFRPLFGIARHLARRFAGRGEAVEDLEQVASIGFIKAMERFDTEHGATFSMFASATILGELKRTRAYRVWSVRFRVG